MREVARLLGYVPGVGVPLWGINFLFQRICRIDASAGFLKHFTARVLHPAGIKIEGSCPYVLRSFQVSGGCYINGADGIKIGRGTIWAPNVSIVSQDHDKENFDNAPTTLGIEIGRDCWLGVGAVILPGVRLGDKTIVGANAVVTRSFPEGGLTLVGVPARPIERDRQ